MGCSMPATRSFARPKQDAIRRTPYLWGRKYEIGAAYEEGAGLFVARGETVVSRIGQYSVLEAFTVRWQQGRGIKPML